jgi:hypothetical protein
MATINYGGETQGGGMDDERWSTGAWGSGGAAPITQSLLAPAAPASAVPRPNAGNRRLPYDSGPAMPPWPDYATPSMATWPTGATQDLSTYWSDPMLQQYTNLGLEGIQRLMGGFGGNSMTASGGAALDDVISSGQHGYADFKKIADRRIGELQNPLFSTGGPINSPEAMRNSDLLRSKFLEPLVQARDAQQKQTLERMAARGMGQSSGLVEDAARGVDRNFEQQLAQGYRDLMLQEVSANEGRKTEAVGIGQKLAELAANPTVASAASAKGNLGLGSSQRSLQELLSAMGISQDLASMPMAQTQSIASLLSLLNGQGNTQGLIQAMLGMSGQGTIAGQNAYNQSSNLWGNVANQGSQLFNNWWSQRQPGGPTQPMPPWEGPTQPTPQWEGPEYGDWQGPQQGWL